jgi:hypothetical protein
MMVIARTKDSVYLRIPRELQMPCTGGCGCDHCVKDPTLANWDTLVVPTKAPKNGNDYAHHVHLPDAQVPAFIEYMKTRNLHSEVK